MDEIKTEKPRRIAVITVHGVGDHPPFQTVRAIGDLLQDLDHEGKPCYTPFTEHKLRLNVRPTVVAHHDDDVSSPGTWGPLHAMIKTDAKPQSSKCLSTGTVDHKLMAAQLQDYKGEGPDDTYETIRLEGAKLTGGKPGPDIDLYEMYWSDLTKVGNAFTSIFSEFYILLFHLGTLGIQTVNAAQTRLRTPAWKRFSDAELLAGSVLAMPLPVLNLIMLAATAAGVVLSLMSNVRASVQLVIASAVACALVGFLAGWRRSMRGGMGFLQFLTPLLICALLIGGAAVWAKTSPPQPRFIEAAFGAFLALVLSAILALVVRAYDRRRPGAWRTFVACSIVLAVLLIGLIAWRASSGAWKAGDHPAIVLAVNVIEAASLLVEICWAGFLVLLMWAHFCGWRAVKSTPTDDPGDMDRARRARWTARLTMALPSFLYIVVTLSVWSLILLLVKPLVPKMEYWSLLAGHHESIPRWAGHALDKAGTEWFPILGVLAGIALVPLIWGLFPAVLAEVMPPNPAKATDNNSTGLGAWLTHGFNFMRLSGRLLYFGMVVVMPFAVFDTVLQLFAGRHAIIDFNGWGGTKLVAQGMAYAAGVLGGTLFAARGKLENIALGFRPLLRVMLDVDNWFREHPSEATPRARICGRFVSLLRYVAAVDERDRRPYDALILFAHSQGTVITTDLMRFIHAESGGNLERYDAELARLGSSQMPVYLLTMGCPLRQLYGLRFPFLYEWSRFEETGRPETAAERMPRLTDLGAASWTNAYRSGDYVGRNLWRSDGDHKVFEPDAVYQNEDGQRHERCIGAGAHTHYWDATAKDIANVLDELVSHAADRVQASHG